MKIKKRTGKEEEYSPKKPHDSILSAGADENTARSISDGIKQHKGMTTSEVRKEVVKELKKMDPKCAKLFEDFKK